MDGNDVDVSEPSETEPLVAASIIAQPKNDNNHSIKSNALNKTSGNNTGAQQKHVRPDDTIQLTKNTKLATLTPPPIAKKPIVDKCPPVPAALKASNNNATSSPPVRSKSSSSVRNNGNGSPSAHLKVPSTTEAITKTPTTIVVTTVAPPVATFVIADSIDVSPTTIASPIESSPTMINARPNHFQSMRSIRSGTYNTIHFTVHPYESHLYF